MRPYLLPLVMTELLRAEVGHLKFSMRVTSESQTTFDMSFELAAAEFECLVPWSY